MRKPALSRATITGALARDFPDLSPLLALVEGEESQAFMFSAGAQNYVVRNNPTAAGFEKDRLAQRRWTSAILPIPKVVLIAPLDGAFLCVSARAPGVTLQDLAPADALAFAPGLGKVMDVLATADVSDLAGFGPFDATEAGTFDSQGAFLADITDPRSHDWPARTNPATYARIAPALDRVARHAAICADIGGLVHGDFGSNNVLCDGATITGVIDWSEAMVGDPLYDLANILFWRTQLPCMDVQAGFFERHQPWRLEKRDTLQTYRLRNWLATLFDALVAGNSALADWAVIQIERTIADRV